MSGQADDDDGVNRTPLGKLLRTHRRRAGLKQTELAEAAGVSESLVSRAEAGGRSIGVENLQLLIDALELSDEQAAELKLARRETSAMLSRKPTTFTGRGAVTERADRIGETADPLDHLAARLRRGLELLKESPEDPELKAAALTAVRDVLPVIDDLRLVAEQLAGGPDDETNDLRHAVADLKERVNQLEKSAGGNVVSMTDYRGEPESPRGADEPVSPLRAADDAGEDPHDVTIGGETTEGPSGAREQPEDFE